MVKRVFIYFAGFFVSPWETASEIAGDPNGLWIGIIFALLFCAVYSLTVLIYYLLHHKPVTKPFLPIPLSKWYLVQTFTTAPMGMAAFFAYSGLAYALSKSVGGVGSFDATFATQTYALIIPCVVFMLSYELLAAPFLIAAGKRHLPWPQWVEILRVFILPFAWIFFLTTVTLSRVHGLHWSESFAFVVVSMIPAGGIMAVFIR
jgi:hypothetical protein